MGVEVTVVEEEGTEGVEEDSMVVVMGDQVVATGLALEVQAVDMAVVEVVQVTVEEVVVVVAMVELQATTVADMWLRCC